MEEDKKIKDIITDYKSKPNKDLEFILEHLSNDFEETKKIIIKLSRHIDATEKIYNDILSEYKSRIKK